VAHLAGARRPLGYSGAQWSSASPELVTEVGDAAELDCDEVKLPGSRSWSRWAQTWLACPPVTSSGRGDAGDRANAGATPAAASGRGRGSERECAGEREREE
jgi:hypothetical protein